MKRTYWIILLILVLSLSACGKAATPAPLPTAALDASNNGNSSSSSQSTASGEIVPVASIKLSFPLTGIVKTVSVAEGDSVTAGQSLVQLDTAILDAQVAQAKANLASAETQVRYLRRVGTSQEYLDSAIADVDRLTAAVQAAEAQLAQATLLAPFAATVVSLDIAPAETVTPGQIVIILGDLSKFKVETTDMSERDVTRLKIGDPVTVFIEALNKEFSGKVADIARSSQTVGGDVVFKVTVDLDEQPEGLRWGMSTEVRIQSGQ